MHTVSLISFRRLTAGIGLFRYLGLALAARRERKALAMLDDSALDDIGITKAQASDEARRPIWDVPANWRR